MPDDRPRVLRIGWGKRQIVIWRERPGVLCLDSDGPTWLCGYGFWLHAAGSLPSLLLDVWQFWKSDYRIVG